MLHAAEAGAFDLIIAWREDRLYRGLLGGMLDLWNLVKQGTIDVDLVRETYDRKFAGIKASVAELELEAFRERSHMAAKARLRAGKPWGVPRYGYRRNRDAVEVEPEEAHWVRQIF